MPLKRLVLRAVLKDVSPIVARVISVPDELEMLAGSPSEQAVIDATRVIFDTQRSAGIDLPTDGELYRFDVNHPDTNGMIEYFIRPLGGVRSEVGRVRDPRTERSLRPLNFPPIIRTAIYSLNLA